MGMSITRWGRLRFRRQNRDHLRQRVDSLGGISRPHLLGLLGFGLIAGLGTDGMAESVSESPPESEGGRFFVDYSPRPDVELFDVFDWSILSIDAEVDLAQAKAVGHRSYAYLSIVEVSRDAGYAAELDRRKIRRVVENPVWGSDSVDITSPAWKQLVIETLAERAVAKGFDGFFLDTVDSLAHLIHKEPERSSEYRAALIGLIKDLKQAYPDKKILVNRGFSLLPDLGEAVDGLVVESVFRTYNFAERRYERSREGDTEQLVKWIKEIRSSGLPVAVIDYVNPGDRQLALQTARRIEALDCQGFITTPALNGALLGPVRERVRRLLVLYGWDEAEHPMAFAADTMVAQRLQTPLEYMGYECDYLNVAKESIPGAIGGKYAGVIFDAELEIPYAKELPYADWLLAQKDEGVKVLFLANLPFSQEDARQKVAVGLGMRGDYTTIARPDAVEIVSIDDEMMGFEAKLQPAPDPTSITSSRRTGPRSSSPCSANWDRGSRPSSIPSMSRTGGGRYSIPTSLSPPRQMTRYRYSTPSHTCRSCGRPASFPRRIRRRAMGCVPFSATSTAMASPPFRA